MTDDLMALYATTHANDDGTFSPAIMVRETLWVEQTHRNKIEEAMLTAAQQHLEVIERGIVRALTDGNYRSA